MDWKHLDVDVRVGDWLEALEMHGGGVRCGQIVDILGGPRHQHFQVRWSKHHESMIFAREVLRIIPSTSA